MENDEKQHDVALINANVEQAVSTMRKFSDLKTKLLDVNDTIKIQGKPFIKRSGWRKISLAFNVTTQILDEKLEERDGVIVATVKCRAIAPNGRFTDELAVCDSTEFASQIQATRHNILSKCTTRAINRSISSLCGGGEVSAEEMVIGDQEPKEAAMPASQKQTDYIKMLIKDNPRGAAFISEYLQSKDGNTTLHEITTDQANELIKKLKMKDYAV